ncbi:MAG TPA: hypothetical protein VJ954_06215 [Ignavibacteriaceae bacterium]|nr:hypothetical protein [Ignavibacteriaceae bacterium]
MKVSVNPLDFIKLYASHKYHEKENIYQYVKKTAIEASEMADIWDNVVKELHLNNQISDGLLNQIRKDIGIKYMECNGRPYTRLTHFYELTSSALGSKISNHWLDKIINSLGSVLYERKLTKNKFEEIVKNNFNTKSENQIMIDDMRKIVENLRYNAEYLYVLAENIKLEKIK